MKKCPTCEKTFADGMRFCQTDGTPLVDAADTAPPDMYKTIVGNQIEVPPVPLDPFKTMIGSAPPPKPKDEDIPELAKEPDSQNTAAPSPASFNEPQVQSRDDFSSAPFKFDEPSKSPSGFGDLPASEKSQETTLDDATAVMNVSSSSEDVSDRNDPKDFGGGFSEKSPYGIQDNKPIPSPFDLSMPPGGFQPLDDLPKPSPVIKPETSYSEPESNFTDPKDLGSQSPFGQTPPSPFGQTPSSPFGQPEASKNPFETPAPEVKPFQMPEPNNQPFQPVEWAPPPAPVSDWQNQNLGSNTPFQPPAPGTAQNQTLPIISLVLGILSLCCYVSPITGIAALITGFLGMKNANNDPAHYGGKTLAIVGMILGGIFLLIGIVYYIFWLVIGFGAIYAG